MSWHGLGRVDVAAVAPVLDAVAYGLMIGTVLGVVIERRARARRPPADAAGIRDVWGVFGALVGLLVGLLNELT